MDVIKNTIVDAIHSRTVLKLKYEGSHRTVEPHAVGIYASGDDVLWCYQTHGAHLTHEKWHLVKLSSIKDLEVTESRFEVRPDYNRDDIPITMAYAEL